MLPVRTILIALLALALTFSLTSGLLGRAQSLSSPPVVGSFPPAGDETPAPPAVPTISAEAVPEGDLGSFPGVATASGDRPSIVASAPAATASGDEPSTAASVVAVTDGAAPPSEGNGTTPVVAGVVQQPCIGVLKQGSTAYIVLQEQANEQAQENVIDKQCFSASGDEPGGPPSGDGNAPQGPPQGDQGKPQGTPGNGPGEGPNNGQPGGQGNGPPTTPTSQGQGAEHSQRP